MSPELIHLAENLLVASGVSTQRILLSSDR